MAPGDIDSMNAMCVMPGTEPAGIMEESTRIHRRVAAMGVRTFGAFCNREPVGRMEIMPVEAAPLALAGDGLWVIRCLWVLDKAEGRGIAGRLMEKAMQLAQGSKGIAVVTYKDWMPVSFFERFGFAEVDTEGESRLLLLKMHPDAAVSFVRDCTPRKYLYPEKSARTRKEEVHVTAVFTGRCPWLMQSWRRWLNAAAELSEKVVTSEITIFNREDAIHFGSEDLYIDGVPYRGSPVQLEPFLDSIRRRLSGKGQS